MLNAQHLQHTLNSHRIYNCFYCSLRFGSESAVEEHTLAKNSRYRCEMCDQGFETKIGLNRHYRDSPAHPNCQHGFEDCEFLEKVKNLRPEVNMLISFIYIRQHQEDAHPRLPC